jgi:SAM-dependent methyltransferase
MATATQSHVSTQGLSLTLEEALARLERFSERTNRRLEGPWRADVARLAASGSSIGAAVRQPTGALWAALVEDAGLAADRVPEALRAAPANVNEVVLLAYIENPMTEARAAFDKAAFTVGFRRHPLVLACASFAEIEAESGWLLLPYERIGAETLRRYPADLLAIERGLHMDMTREAGRRSDAHLARYHFASERVGREDRVLDAACGLGYGSALLWRDAPGRRVTGVDLSPWVVEYATDNFGAGGQGPRYARQDVYDLSTFEDESFDSVVSFETIEHLLDPAPFLRHVRRVLVRDGLFVASVPYRWVINGDTGKYHHDWYDVPKFLELCGRFLSVEDLWVETAGGGLFFGDAPRGLRRCPTLGEVPDDPVEWLVLVGRKRCLVQRPEKTWMFLAPGLPQLATMAAALPHWGIRPEEVAVVGNTFYWDDHFHAVMQAASEALGLQYGGVLPLNPSPTLLGDPSGYRLEAEGDGSPGDARVVSMYPLLEDLQGLNVVMPARPTMVGDPALLEGFRPGEVRLAADGIQNDCVVRDLTAVPGLEDNPLACWPTSSEIVCPPPLESETASIGHAWPVDAGLYADALASMRTIPQARPLLTDIAARAIPFTAVVISQNFSRAGLTSPEAAWIFYLHQIRWLLRHTPGSVLFKAHSRDCVRKLAVLSDALRGDAARVRMTVDAENHLPLEIFASLTERSASLEVWGTSSSALLGAAAWPGALSRCVDADYLEPEIRRQALQFSRRHGLPLVTLRFDDPLLGEDERAQLRRRFVSPVESAVTDLATRLQDAEHARLSAEDEVRRVGRENQLLEKLLVAGGKSVWLWGTGAGGRRLLQRLRALGIEPEGFIDGGRAAARRELDGLSVLPAEEARQARKPEALVVIASMYVEDIQRRIRTDGDWRSSVAAWGG